ncbi:tyrosine-protein phosphatase [Microbacterium halophytorum]|uniref:tyrosine-protein phosphatase n=1 Tax=Microbacterium halophytorum TaxID=2067568 RepID=UPI000CFB9568|nr:tyrosine-protein phosphatase [Microbacterium halophytorum]
MTLIDDTAIPLSAPANLRDLGGIPVAGGAVRRGFALRADDLSTIDEASADELVAAGLGAVIDLRSNDEVGFTGRGALGARDVSYHHVPFMASISDAGTGEDLHDQSRYGRMYIRIFEGSAHRVVEALAILAHAPGTVAFHCSAGQDRTGVLAAALLLVLGADADDIVADYARTGENKPAMMVRLRPTIGRLMARMGVDLDAAAKAAGDASFSPRPMRELIAHLTQEHGDPLRPLREAGLTDGLIARLRERALA